MSYRFFGLFALITLMSIFFGHKISYAQMEYLENGYTDTFLDYKEGPGAQKKDRSQSGLRRYIYEEASFKAISHLYWAVNLYDVEDDEAVEFYIRINECSIYQSFGGDEIEWQKVRDATRLFLSNNKQDFPTRFEFVIPLRLGDFDKIRSAFKVEQGYEIKSSRRFEFVASGMRNLPCFRAWEIPRIYPYKIVMEYSRPFSLEYIPATEEYAIDYIARISAYVKSRYKESLHRNPSILQKHRTAYLFLKTKIFTHGKVFRFPGETEKAIQLIGVLEGYDVYEDLSKTRLVFSENYVANRNSNDNKTDLKDQFAILLKKSKEKGILH